MGGLRSKERSVHCHCEALPAGKVVGEEEEGLSKMEAKRFDSEHQAVRVRSSSRSSDARAACSEW